MLGWLVKRRIANFERDFDYDFTYARDIYDACDRVARERRPQPTNQRSTTVSTFENYISSGA
jgi:hypothetical protein